MESLYIGTLTFHIESKKSRLKLPHEQMKVVANQFISGVLSKASSEFQIEFEYKLVNIYAGCIKAKFKLFVKASTWIAIAAFFLKYPDVRNNMWEFFKDVGSAYECTINGAEKECYLQILSGEIVSYTHETKEGDSLSEVVENWVIPGYTTYQVMVGTYKQNPHAFIGGNINKLKIGTILSSPTKENLKGIPESKTG